MPCKIIQFEHFDPAADMKWVRCPECERAVNVYGKPIHEPLTFGSATNKPEVMTHFCIIRCRCRATAVKVYGRMKTVQGIGGVRPCK